MDFPFCILKVLLITKFYEIVYSSVNSKFFAQVLFHKTSHMRSLEKIKLSQYGEITLSLTDIGKSYPVRKFLKSQIYRLTLFAIISEYTVYLSLVIVLS